MFSYNLRVLIFIFSFLAFSDAQSKVEARWMTVASVVIDDGKSRILFDPAWSRPTLIHWLGVRPFRSDEALVKSVLDKASLKRVDAVFASHSHFDHVVDAPIVSKLSGAVFYVDQSSEQIAKAYDDQTIRTIRLTPSKEIRIGEFLITPILREHSKLLQKFDFLPGPVPKDMQLAFWDYHVGDSWLYLIKHPEGVILVDQGCESHADKVIPLTENVDALLQGFASRKDDETILEGYLKTYKPKVYVPLHFDNFFVEFEEGAEGDLPGVEFDRLLGKIKKAYPSMKTDRPQYGKPITLLEVER